MTNPLISVIMPCYNSADTLPLAFSSLLAQEYGNWECVIVDDGSSDDPASVVRRLDDPRIRLIRFETNQGRGAARQAALDHSRGDYLAMLDADDWLFPDKLRRQVECMTEFPDVTLVSTGMSIVNAEGQLVGVRSCGTEDVEIQRFDRLAMPPVAHAPSMIRMQPARRIAYDPHFRLAQDVDYLLRLMMGRSFIVLPSASYVYSEWGSISPSKVISALGYTSEMFRKHRRSFPLASAINRTKVLGKQTIYRLAFAVGLTDYMIARRSSPPADSDRRAFDRAIAVVRGIHDRYFPAAGNENPSEATSDSPCVHLP